MDSSEVPQEASVKSEIVVNDLYLFDRVSLNGHCTAPYHVGPQVITVIHQKENEYISESISSISPSLEVISNHGATSAPPITFFSSTEKRLWENQLVKVNNVVKMNLSPSLS